MTQKLQHVTNGVKTKFKNGLNRLRMKTMIVLGPCDLVLFPFGVVPWLYN